MRSSIIIGILGLLFVITACGTPTAPTLTPEAVLNAFEAAGLNVTDITTTDIIPAAIANALPTCSGARFNVEGEQGARVIICSDRADAERLATYYETLGNENPLFFSHVHRDQGVVLQMNGSLPAELFQQYVAALP
jgi:hypothetical protein